MTEDEKDLERKLIQEAKSGNEEAEEMIFRRYKNLIKIKAYANTIVGADVEDVMQEGMIGLFKAVRNFDENRDASFKTYAETCINNQIINAIKRYSRKKHLPLNSSVSLDNETIFLNENDMKTTNYVGKSSEEPEAVLLMKEKIKNLQDESVTCFSRFENEVMIGIIRGISQKEIAEKLGKNEKSIENAVQRIRKKLENHFSS